MRYIKTYKIFERLTGEEIKSTCEDILLELSDDGFDCRVTVNNWGVLGAEDYKKWIGGPVNWVSVTIYRKLEFTEKDIDYVVRRLEQYLDSEDIHNDVKIPYKEKPEGGITGRTSTNCNRIDMLYSHKDYDNKR